MCVCKGEEKGIDQRKGGEGEWQAAAEGQKLPAFSVLVPTGQEMGGRPPAVLGLDGGGKMGRRSNLRRSPHNPSGPYSPTSRGGGDLLEVGLGWRMYLGV